MGSIPRLSMATGDRRPVPTAPLPLHFARYANIDKTALIFSDENDTASISYTELEAQSNALARVLASKARVTGRNRDGDYVIAICMQPNHNTVSSLLSTMKAGAAYVPMEPTFPQARVLHIVQDAQPALILYDDTAKPSMFSSCEVPATSFEELLLEASSMSTDELKPHELLNPIENESIAIVLYTSGSTGIPKGVRLSYEAICNRLWWQFNIFPYADDEEKCVWKTALTFVDSVSEIWGPLLNGRTLLILSKEATRDPQQLVNALASNEIQRLVLVPTLLRSILMYISLNPTGNPLKKLKLWICSGETLNKGLAGEFFKYFNGDEGYQLANFYGSTEVMGDVTYYVIENADQLDLFNTIPIGYPLQNSAVYLLDTEMNMIREGETGELYVSGRNLASGYVGGQAPEKFCDNPHAKVSEFSRLYRTGDFGVLHKGVILYAGRTDSQIKIRGHRVDLQEVERAVLAVVGVDKGVVLCYGLDLGAPEILAFVTLKEDARLGAQHIEAALKSALTSYMIPQVIVIENVPLLVNGKVDRQALLKMYENTNNNDDTSISIDYDYSGVDKEEMEVARTLFETIGEVLGRSVRGALSIRAGFFELGGNSLNSIYTITKLRDKGYFIQISDFLSAANLGEVLSHLSVNPGSEKEAAEPKFKAEPMRDEHKNSVIDMIVASFCEKAELEQFLRNEIKPADYTDLINATWTELLAVRLSVVLRDSTGTPVAVALNFDVRDEPDIELDGGLAKIMSFLEFVEGPVRDSMLPQGKGMILHSFMMATAAHLSTQDNVSAIRALEHATIRLARDRGFAGVFTTNTSPLTQQLGTDVLGFKTLLDFQINTYVDANGEKPFGKAADDMRAIVCWKPVE